MSLVRRIANFFSTQPSFKKCAAKSVTNSIELLKASPEGSGWDEVNFVTTLECPKTLITGSVVIASINSLRLHNSDVLNSAKLLRDIASTAMCPGCPFVNMGVNEAYKKAEKIVKHRSTIMNILSEPQQYSQPPTYAIEQNPDDLR